MIKTIDKIIKIIFFFRVFGVFDILKNYLTIILSVYTNSVCISFNS